MSVLGSMVALGLAAAVSAGDGGVAIAWEGPLRCADGSRAQATFDRLVGAPRDDLAGAMRVDVVEDGASLRATVVIDDGEAQTRRELQSPDCETLSDAVALVGAVALDPLGATETVVRAIHRPVEAQVVEPVPPPAIPVADDGPSSPVPAPAAEARRRARPPLRGSVLVSGGGTVGLAPPVGGMLEGGLALGVASARIELSALHRFRARLVHPDDDRVHGRVHADFTLTAGRVSAGWAPTVGRFEFPMLAGIELGAFTGTSSGLTNTVTRSALWAAVVPRFRPTVRATRWLAIGLDLQLPVALWREHFVVDDFDRDLLHVGPVGFRFGLCLDLIFVDESERSRARRVGEA